MLWGKVLSHSFVNARGVVILQYLPFLWFDGDIVLRGAVFMALSCRFGRRFCALWRCRFGRGFFAL